MPLPNPSSIAQTKIAVNLYNPNFESCHPTAQSSWDHLHCMWMSQRWWVPHGMPLPVAIVTMHPLRRPVERMMPYYCSCHRQMTMYHPHPSQVHSGTLHLPIFEHPKAKLRHSVTAHQPEWIKWVPDHGVDPTVSWATLAARWARRTRQRMTATDTRRLGLFSLQ